MGRVFGAIALAVPLLITAASSSEVTAKRFESEVVIARPPAERPRPTPVVGQQPPAEAPDLELELADAPDAANPRQVGFTVTNRGGSRSEETTAYVVTPNFQGIQPDLLKPRDVVLPGNPFDVYIKSLDQGESTTFTYRLAEDCDGTVITAVVRTTKNQAGLAEWNIGNGVLEDVKACASIERLPTDLGIWSISVHAANTSQRDCDPGNNEVSVTVRNFSAGNPGPVVIGLEVDGDEAESLAVPGIAPNSDATITFHSVRLNKGEHVIKASAHAGGVVSEYNRGKNEEQIAVTCTDEA